MNNLETVKKITKAFLVNHQDIQAVNKYFAPNFQHTVNGVTSDVNGYKMHLTKYARKYKNFRVPKWSEALEVGDKVVVAYTLIGERKEGGEDKIAVMAIWQLGEGKVIALREVDAKG